MRLVSELLLPNFGLDSPTEDQEAVILARIYELILRLPQNANAPSAQSQDGTKRDTEESAKLGMG